MNHPPKVALGLFPGAIFYLQIAIVKNSSKKYFLFVPFCSVSKISKCDNRAGCSDRFPFVYPKHIIHYILKKAPANSVVEAFVVNRQKDSSKILGKNFFDVIRSSFPHLFRIVDIGGDDGLYIVTK